MLVLVLGSLIAVSPASLHLQLGGTTSGKVTASASKPIGLAKSSCFTIGGSPRDILRVSDLRSVDSPPFRTLTIDVRAQHPEVVVKPQKP